MGSAPRDRGYSGFASLHRGIECRRGFCWTARFTCRIRPPRPGRVTIPAASRMRSGEVRSTGFCGAGVRGFLRLVTGLHTGYVRFTAELHPVAPPLGDDWEEAVEVSFRHRAKKLWLGGLMSDAPGQASARRLPGALLRPRDGTGTPLGRRG